MRTKDRLAAALREIGLGDMAEKAAAGHYDDYESDLVTPCTQLVIDLGKAHTRDARELAKRVKEGEFDATAEEAEEWWQREGKHLFPGLSLKDLRT